MRQLFLFSFVILLVVLACNKDEDYLLDSSAELSFSVDTLRFDTVFTEIGSATRLVKVYNTNDRPVRLNSVRLKERENSVFRINVDGIPAAEVNDTEIAAGDSIYIFAEVTVDPNSPLSTSPFIIEEFLEVELNGNTRNILLEAWGQNANYIPNRFNQGGGALISCDFGEFTFDDPKPYVIYGVLLVDSCTLNIPAGTEIYIHGGIVRTGILGEVYDDGYIFTLPNGSLNIQGTKEEPVTIQGDRLEDSFGEVAGQWGGIYLSRGSRGNTINHAIIKNARFGMYVDSAATVVLNNTTIANCISGGLIGVRSNITANNCLIYGNGGNAVQLEYGGNYTFRYCTLTSYGVDSDALRLSNALCLDEFCTQARLNTLRARFINSIIYGSRSDEIDLFNVEGAGFNYTFENCVVRVDDLVAEDATPDFFDNCTPCIPEAGTSNSDIVLFEDTGENDFHLDSLSIAEGYGRPVSNILLDLEDNPRDGTMPDAGCFEKLD